MLASRISRKGQATVPKKVRETLGLGTGDYVGYRIEDGLVTLKRLEPFDAAFHSALSQGLDEWHSPEDEEAFRFWP